MRTNKLIPISLSALIVICLTIGVALIALAVHDLEFQLEGDIADEGTGVDWANFFDVNGTPITPLPTNFVASSFTKDFVMDAAGPDRTTFTTGSKDTLNISPGWQCARSNNVNDKIDLLNVYATAYAEPGTGDTIIYFALERFSNDGDANVAFWFLQDPTVGCIAPASGPSTTSFTGNHMDGDLLIVSSFTKGGVVSTVTGYEWVGGADGHLNTTPLFN